MVWQWRICLPMQGTRVWSLVQEDSACHRATKLVSHRCWAHALEPVSCNEKPTHCNRSVVPACAPRESLCEARKAQGSQEWMNKQTHNFQNLDLEELEFAYYSAQNSTSWLWHFWLKKQNRKPRSKARAKYGYSIRYHTVHWAEEAQL